LKRELLTQESKKLGKRPIVAGQLKISVIHLRKLESGDVNPSVPVMKKICSLFKRKPEELFPELVE
jgi:transcriptional regulator with XRE-family HTH domain